MSVSVIVPFYNAERYIEDCVRHLLDQDFSAGNVELIMVDNNSQDRSVSIIKRFPEVILLHEAKQGAYAARNTGLKRASHEIIAFTDPDCAPAPDWLGTIDEAMRDPGTDLVLGSHLPGKEVFFLSLMFGYMNEQSRYVFSSNIQELYYGYTNNMAVRGALFEELGYFIERERGADTLFVQRYLKFHSCSGIHYQPDLCVRHLEITTLRNLYGKFFLYARSRERYRHIASVRALTNSERLAVFNTAILNGNYTAPEVLITFALLVVGAGFWYWGNF
jgi:glycosyltransferase involved in cell wall biosynthesis